MMSKLGAALAVAGALLLPAGTAFATPPHYTDGTTFDGQTNFGPPPLAPAFSTSCGIAIVDPASFVFVTLHFVYGTTAPTAGAVPVHDDAALVVNYVGSAPGTFDVDVTSFVAGQQGFLAYTWNIGTGVTAWVPFSCTPPTTSTSIATEGSTTIEPTTTTVGPTGSTVEPPTSTSTIVNEGSTEPGATSTGELPFTGGDNGPLAIAAAVLIAAGTLFATRNSVKRR
jgi:hypothetical protein